jgi:hypothetical protein
VHGWQKTESILGAVVIGNRFAGRAALLLLTAAGCRLQYSALAKADMAIRLPQ